MVLSGDATLRYTGFDDHVPIWETTGEIDVQPAAICEGNEIGHSGESDGSSDGEG